MNKVMDCLIDRIKKWQPYFDAFAANKYVSGMRNGLIAPMYVLLFSSIFMVITYVPNILGFYWSESVESMLLRPYDLTMGVYGLIVSATVAKAFTDILNQEQETGKSISALATMVSALSVYLILMGDPVEGGISTEYLGASGMIVGIIIGLVIPKIFKFSIDHNLTIKLPKEVPPNLSESFASVIAYGLAITVFWIFDIIFKNFSGGTNVAEALMNVLNPIFMAAESYIGMSLIYGATAFFQFLGMNGPDIVFPAVKPAMFQHLAENQELYRQGLHSFHAMTNASYDMAIAFGGTGATLMVTLMFAFLSKSKGNRAVGRAAIVPVLFNVNEPITFGAPLILSPIFLVPFILAPIANTILLRLFITTLGMNGFIMEVPWTTPGFIGTILGTNFDPLSFLLVPLIAIVDAIIYYPFFRVYDQKVLEDEKAKEELVLAGADELTVITEELAEKPTGDSIGKDKLNVLVLCAGGGTSGMLANALNDSREELKEEYGVEFTARGGHYGQHSEFMSETDVVILAPQVSSHLTNMQNEAVRHDAIALGTGGSEYIKYTQDPKSAAEFILNSVSKQ
ncbi:MAG: PTS transporter subunit EIIC [Clostridiaceae bacterium]|nr:PTS transporter subunit EIIC [Clostridiaceae bacterium]MBW4859283.1 PTS transporter subunit EIIC [Clostridiaceae bacterium]MBW4868740.1 PTS transporter subunit EIIC [Clostridiaceae bacterium]